MRPGRARAVAFLLPLIAACAHQIDRSGTLATLHQVQSDTKEVPVDQGLDRAVQSYRDFLQQAPDSKLAPEAMRRLADLKIEKEFGIQGDGKLIELPASQSGTPGKASASGAVAGEPPSTPGRDQAASLRAPAVTKINPRTAARSKPQAPATGPAAVSEHDLEQRAASEAGLTPANAAAPLALPGGMEGDAARAGPLEAIKLYDE
jgi:cellulose synthase operon protein C